MQQERHRQDPAFGLEAGGHSWHDRRRELAGLELAAPITDASGTEVARITKTREGLAKTMFTSAGNYVVQIHLASARGAAAVLVSPPARRRHGAQAESPGLS